MLFGGWKVSASATALPRRDAIPASAWLRGYVLFFESRRSRRKLPRQELDSAIAMPGGSNTSPQMHGIGMAAMYVCAQLSCLDRFTLRPLIVEPGAVCLGLCGWLSVAATPHTTSPSCGMTWTGSSSCSAAMTARPCSAPMRRIEAVTVASPLRGPQERRSRRPRRHSSSRTPRRYSTAPGFDKGSLARTLTGPCGQVASLPDRRQAYGSSPLVKSLHPPDAVTGHRSTQATARHTGSILAPGPTGASGLHHPKPLGRVKDQTRLIRSRIN
jgi:hypothetical protein